MNQSVILKKLHECKKNTNENLSVIDSCLPLSAQAKLYNHLLIREAAKKTLFLVAWPIRGGGGKGLATKIK